MDCFDVKVKNTCSFFVTILLCNGKVAKHEHYIYCIMHLLWNAPFCASTVSGCRCCRIHCYVALPFKRLADFFLYQALSCVRITFRRPCCCLHTAVVGVPLCSSYVLCWCCSCCCCYSSCGCFLPIGPLLRLKYLLLLPKERHGVWNKMPELTITSPYIHSRVDFKIFTVGNSLPESTLALCQSRLYPIVRDFGFGLWCWRLSCRWHSQNFDVLLLLTVLKLLFFLLLLLTLKGPKLEISAPGFLHKSDLFG